MELYFYLLPYAILLGVISTYTDIKSGKIKNSLLFPALLFIFITILMFFILFLRNIDYVLDFMLSLLFSFIFGIVLWINGVWGAADAKLFFIFSMCVTPGMIHFNYSRLYIVNFFMNIILVSFIFSLVSGFLKFKSSLKVLLDHFKLSKNIFSLSELWIMLLMMISLGYLVSRFNFFDNPIDKTYFTFGMVFVMMHFLRKIKYFNIVLLVLSLVSLFLNFSNASTLSYWINLLKSTLFFSLIRISFNFLSNINVYYVNVSDLKKGMHLAQDFIIHGKDGTKIALSEEIEYDNCLGITEKNIDSIKDKLTRISKTKILIMKKQYFAQFIFLGFLLTLILKTNLITFIRLLF